MRRLLVCLVVAAATNPISYAASAPATSPSTLSTTNALIGDDTQRPSLISFRGTSLAAREAYDQLGRQLGVQFKVQKEEEWELGKPVTINCVNEPFWNLLRNLERQSTLMVHYSHEHEIGLMPRDWYIPWFDFSFRHVQAGPCVLLLGGVTREQNVTLGRKANANRKMQLSARLLMEPRLQVLQSSHFLSVLEAVDDKGESLLVQPPQSPELAAPRTNWRMSYGRVNLFNIDLKIVNPPSKRIAKLRLRHDAFLVDRNEMLEVDDVQSKGKIVRRVGDVTWTFEFIEETTEGCRVQITSTREPGMPAEKWEALARPRGMSLIETTGDVATYIDGTANDKGDAWEAVEHYRRHTRAGQTPPLKLRWSIPVDARLEQWNFEFADVPLP
jgi:hypothetical protein